ncbi:MAG: chemotaxis protein CheW [Micrococcales bacterium]|nr:MAG: chemotaxis protein CheW [Micrococcales bacterium]PIE26567.1 MAG: chemotaxis protein CheW [Micrococcales bacterium]
MTQLVTFTLGPHTFGVDVGDVQEVLRGQARTRVPLAPKTLAGLINLRGQVLTAIELREVFQLPDRENADDAMMVLIRVDGEPIALLVDTIGAVVTVHQEQFEPPPDTLSGQVRGLIRGAYKLDGELLLSMDIEQAVAA